LIPFSIMKVKATWSSALTQSFLLTIVYCASFFLPICFQAVRGRSPMMSGVFLLPSIGTQLLTALVGGSLGKQRQLLLPSSKSHVSLTAF
jgi:hypothetical protein